MTNDRELMQQALEALEQVAEYFSDDSCEAKTINALRERLAQPDHEPVAVTRMEDGYIKIDYLADPFPVGPLYVAPLQPAPEQEPVAWATRMGEYAHIHWGAKRPEYPVRYEVPLYTSPPASKPWVGLTDEDIKAWPTGWANCLRWAESKLREKNA